MPLNKQKCRFGLIAGAFLGILFWLNPDQYVIGVPVAGAVDRVGDVSDIIYTITGFALSIANFISWVCFALLTYLLDPHFIFDLGDGGEGGDFLEVLRSIWQLSRDLMNVVFAIMLVFAALYVIIMNKKDFIQEHAAKFMIAIVFVNFSWFFPRVILDISAVLTSTVYGIPSLISTECVAEDDDECLAVTSIIFLPSDVQREALSEDDGWDCERMARLGCVQLQPLSSSNVSASSTVLNGLIINHGRLLKLGEIPALDLGETITDRALFAVRNIIVLIIAIALVFPLVAMCVAFFLRIPMLWITMAFMPFYFLDLVAGEKLSQGLGKKIWDNFLSAAFLPALVAVPLSVGYILLNAGDQVAFESLESIPFRLIDGIGTLHELMWLFLSLAVMWTGVFGVLKKQEIIGKGAERIEGFGKEVGKLAINTPLSLPLVPGMAGGGPTISGILNASRPSLINSQLKQGRSLKEVLADIPKGGRGTGGTVLANEAKKADTVINNNPTLKLSINKSIDELSKAKTADEVDKAAAKLIKELESEGKVRGVNRSNLEEFLRELKKNPNALSGKIDVKEDALTKLRNPPTPPAAPAVPAAPARDPGAPPAPAT